MLLSDNCKSSVSQLSDFNLSDSILKLILSEHLILLFTQEFINNKICYDIYTYNNGFYK